MNKIKRLNVFRQRRVLIVGAAAIPALAWAGALHAQQPSKVWRVGFLAQRAFESPFSADSYSEFVKGMAALGYVDGKNLKIEWRSAEGKIERLPALAAELVRLNPDVIVVVGAPSTRAVQQLTTNIPIVMASVGDPVGQGLIKSLARPGGNTTGMSNLNLDLGSKRLEMILAVVPKLTRLAVLVNPDNRSGAALIANIQPAAQKIGVKLFSIEVRAPGEINREFASMVQQKIEAVIVAQDPLLIQERRLIAELTIKYRLPSISGYREYADAGGLMSYGQDLGDLYNRSATHVDKIFKGVKPSDIPVEQPIKFDMVFNMKTAKALGLKPPPVIMVQATKVIE